MTGNGNHQHWLTQVIGKALVHNRPNKKSTISQTTPNKQSTIVVNGCYAGQPKYRHPCLSTGWQVRSRAPLVIGGMVLVVMGLGWTMTTQSQIEEGKSKPLVGMESHIRAGY